MSLWLSESDFLSTDLDLSELDSLSEGRGGGKLGPTSSIGTEGWGGVALAAWVQSHFSEKVAIIKLSHYYYLNKHNPGEHLAMCLIEILFEILTSISS